MRTLGSKGALILLAIAANILAALGLLYIATTVSESGGTPLMHYGVLAVGVTYLLFKAFCLYRLIRTKKWAWGFVPLAVPAAFLIVVALG